VPLQSLILGWDDITNANFLVGDASNVNDWNTFFDLPTNGTPFTSVVVTGNDVELYDGSGINLKNSLFLSNTNLLFVDDTANCIITAGIACFASCASIVSFNLPLLQTAGSYCFYNCASVTSFNLPLLENAGGDCFSNCISATSFDLPSLETADDYCFFNSSAVTSFDFPSCINLGSTTGNDGVFNGVSSNTITLTVPSALMTCNGGNPDGDIQELQAYNTVTIITV
jgi:hypothetical protein